MCLEIIQLRAVETDTNMYFSVSRLFIPCMESIMCLIIETYYAQHAFLRLLSIPWQAQEITPTLPLECRTPPLHRQGCAQFTDASEDVALL